VRYVQGMATTATASRVLGKLADERRLRVLSAIALGESRAVGVAERTGLSQEDTARALVQLLRAGVVVQGEDGLRVEQRVFAEAARAAATPRTEPDLSDASPEQAAVLRNFVDGEGRIVRLPARAAKRGLVLDYVVTRFAADRPYTEREVNSVLEPVFDDYVTLRRLLVDEGLLERDAGVYHRPATTS
jgi:hypothetical protein